MKAKLFVLFQIIFLNCAFGQTANPYWQNFTSGLRVADICFKGDTALITSAAGLSKIISGAGLVENYNSINSPIRTNSSARVLSASDGSIWMSSAEEGLYHITNGNWELHDQWNRYNYGQINLMALDGSDRLFMVAYDSAGEYRGLVKYDGNSFIEIDSINSLIKTSSISELLRDYSGNIWLLSRNYVFKQNGNSWVLVDSLIQNSPGYTKIAVDAGGDLWTLNFNPFKVSKLTNNGWEYFDSTGVGLDSMSGGYGTLYADPLGSIWVRGQTRANKRFLSKFDGTNWTTYDAVSSPAVRDFISAMSTSPNGHTWFSTLNGLYEFDGVTWSYYNSSQTSFTGTSVDKLIFDKNDHAWFQGPWLIEKNDTSFTRHITDCYDLTVDTNNVVWSVARNSSNYTAPILSHYDGTSWITDSSLIGRNGLIASDQQNVKWISGSGGGIIKYTDSVEAEYTTTNSPLVIASPIELFCDRRGNLWINGSNVLQKFDGVNWTTFVPQLWGFPFEWANGLTEDRYGNVWGYCGGGNRLSRAGKYDGLSWTSFEPIGGWPSKEIYSMVFDQRNDMWASFPNLGIGKYDGTSWTLYTPANSPLPGRFNYHLNVDRFNNIWISNVYDGLTIFNPDGIQFNTPFPAVQRISGQVFHDVNSNGIRDVTENGLQQQRILVLPDSIVLTTNSLGLFSHIMTPGEYELIILPFNNWNVTTDSLSYHIHVDSSTVAVPDFGLNATPFHNVEITNTSAFLYCGALGQVWLNYTNTGSVSDSGMVTLQFDSIYDYYSSLPPEIRFNDTIAQWNFNALAPFETRTIKAQLISPWSPGNVFSSRAEINFMNGPQVIANAIAYQSDSIDCYDDATVALNVFPIGLGSQHLINIEDTIVYTIRFQNTGNTSVSFLSIIDTLDINLDLSFFRIVATSHTVNYSFSGRTITFDFPGLSLPDSATDALGSQGFITFSATLKNVTPNQTVVRNFANLTFDFANSFQTNEVFNTVQRSGVSIDENSKSSVLYFYPNPANDLLQISYFGEIHSANTFLQISDVFGRKLIITKIASSKINIDVSAFNNGFYIVSIIDDKSGKLESKRLIIQK